ncbi:cytochrome-c oxidase subunit VIIa [Scleroderma citrinum]
MPIAPITGKLRKRLWLDLSVALGLGVAAAYGFWYGVHLKAGKPNQRQACQLS